MHFVCRRQGLDSRAAFSLARGGKRPGKRWRHALVVGVTRARFRTRRTTSRPIRRALVLSAGKRKESGLAPKGRMSELNKRLGKRIRELRNMLSFTQEELAEKANISVSFLSMIERAQRMPHVETLATISEVLGVPLSELFVGVNEPGKDRSKALLPLIGLLEDLSLRPDEVEALVTVVKAMFKRDGEVKRA